MPAIAYGQALEPQRVNVNLTSRRTLLVVDDDPSIREVLERYFQVNGFELLVAADGQEALEQAAWREIEAVLLDVGMPGLSGIDVLRRLRADKPQMAVIMLTAAADLDLVVEAMKLGAYDYVTKPFDLADLRQRVEEALKKREVEIQREQYLRRTEETMLRQRQELQGMTTLTIKTLIAEESLRQNLGAVGRPRKDRSTRTDTDAFRGKILSRFLSAVGGSN